MIKKLIKNWLGIGELQEKQRLAQLRTAAIEVIGESLNPYYHHTRHHTSPRDDDGEVYKQIRGNFKSVIESAAVRVVKSQTSDAEDQARDLFKMLSEEFFTEMDEAIESEKFIVDIVARLKSTQL